MPEPAKYTLKTDPQGMVGRECPNRSCKAYFKVNSDDLSKEELTCPVCGRKNYNNKYTTLQQVDYINSVIFKRDVCSLGADKYTKSTPVIDYVEVPAKCVMVCDKCGKKFGVDQKPSYCPFCEAKKEHLTRTEYCKI
jgi:Zn finger protein HypA/HybF involved in hydrogenase expression